MPDRPLDADEVERVLDALAPRLEELRLAAGGSAFPFACLSLDVEGASDAIEVESRAVSEGVAASVSIARSDDIRQRLVVRGAQRYLLRRDLSADARWRPDNSVAF